MTLTVQKRMPDDATHRPFRHWFTQPLLFLAACLLLFEEWVWDWASGILRRIGRWPGFRAVEQWVVLRGPYQALALLVAPVVVALALKLIGFWLLGYKHAMLGLCVLVLDKIITMTLFARLWQLTEPALTRIGWVLRGRDFFLHLRRTLYGWLHALPAYQQARARLQQLRRQGGPLRRLRAALRLRRRRQPATPT